MTDNDPTISGEARLRSKRRAFWRYLVVVFIGFVLAGFFTGYVTSAYEDGTIPLWVPLAFLTVTIAALLWYTFDYFRRVDELDVMDNLWSHLIGMYGGVLVFGVWYFFADIGLVDYPAAAPVIGIMIAITFLVYAVRKLGLR